MNVPMAPIYCLLDKPLVCSIDMRTVCRKADTLTIDPDSKTGFEEIDVVPPTAAINPDYEHLIYPDEDYRFEKITTKEIAVKLLKIVEDYFRDTWDGNSKHVIMHSGGKDSRIISMTLEKLEKELGKDWLGEVLFVHHLEGRTDTLFKAVMKQSGWRTDQWHINSIDNRDGPDHFHYAEFEANVNAFWMPTFKWWSQAIPLEDEKDWVSVWGSEGNWLGKKGKHTWWKYVGYYPYYSEHYAAWKGFLCPYTSYAMLDLNFKLPLEPQCHSEYPNVIRQTALDLLGNKLPVHVHHQYNFNLSKGRRSYIKKKFLGSKLYNDFKFIKDARPWEKGMYEKCVDNKLYGLATMYEGI